MCDERKTAGAILGAVAGDCVGSPYIFMKANQLFEASRQICWQIYQMGAVSQLMMAGIRALYHHGFWPDGLVRQYYRSLNMSMCESDMITSQFFAQSYADAAQLYAKALGANHGALCSGQLLLRQVPIVIAGYYLSAETIVSQMDAEARLTHVDPDSIEFAQLYGLCLYGILHGWRRVEVWDGLFARVTNRTVYRTLLNSYYEKPVCDASGYSLGGVTFQMALYHYWHNTPFVSAIRSAALAGGATDVNCAAVGCLLGASQGVEAVPKAWQDILMHEVVNSRALRRSVSYATKLAEMGSSRIVMSSRTSVKSRQRTHRQRVLRYERETTGVQRYGTSRI